MEVGTEEGEKSGKQSSGMLCGRRFRRERSRPNGFGSTHGEKKEGLGGLYNGPMFLPQS